MPDSPARPSLTAEQVGSELVRITCSGEWKGKSPLPAFSSISRTLEGTTSTTRIVFDGTALGAWDSRLVSILADCVTAGRKRNATVALDTLPSGICQLLQLAEAVPDATEARKVEVSASRIARLGEWTLQGWIELKGMLTFLGDSVVALHSFLTGKARFRWSDVIGVMQQCGPGALPIVLLINFLVGLILAFVGAVQLAQFGASIYVADLVGVATVREMGALMTGVIMCGRTGAAFAAQLGTMEVNEEIDAFSGFGIRAMEFLVLPRMLALFLMMPLLVVFADLVAMFGGYLVGIFMLDLTSAEYINRTIAAVSLTNFSIGIMKAAFFGALVAIAGCLRGLNSGRSAAAVGEATTSAVVTGITWIIASDAFFAVLCQSLGI